MNVVTTVRANKLQCQEVAERSARILQELRRLPEGICSQLIGRGVFVELGNTFEAALDLCQSFQGKRFLNRILSWASDATKFADIVERLNRISSDAQLALQFDQQTLLLAQQRDGEYAQELLRRIETQGDLVLSEVTEMRADIATKQDLDELKQMILYHNRGFSSRASSTSSLSNPESEATSAAAAMPAQHTWQLYDKEIVRDMRLDEDGEEEPIELGSGSFGSVVAGTFRQLRVAIKTVKFKTDIDRASFLQEVTILDRLGHPNIARFFGAVQKTAKGVLVLGRLRCSLSDALHMEKYHLALSIEEKRRMSMEIASGMLYLHTTRPMVIHRDLKPSNVMLDERGACKIIDFGLAHVKMSSRMSTKMTANTGTLPYGTGVVWRQTNKPPGGQLRVWSHRV